MTTPVGGLFFYHLLSYTQYMNRTAVEEIKARIPIEELIGSYIKIEKSGRALKARCPFHNEKTPSFFISPERGGYYCFGCGAKGDIFSFVEQFEGLDFKGALKVLAEKAGVQLVYEKKNDGEKDFLFEIMEEATRYFEQQLAGNNHAKEYIKKRGITDETKHSFRIGWAPEGWQNLHEHLRNKGWKDNIIELAGLIKQSDRAEDYSKNSNPQPSLNNSKVRYYDRFRGRIIFPITDSSGRVVAFTGRILVDDGKSAKYLNSPETPIFIKSDILFGLYKAKSEIRRLNYSILVEGQMDLILSHQAGLRNTIAASGTALTDNATGQNGIVSNLGLVRRLSQNMIIALDSDKAGKTATMRAVVATAIGLGMSIKIADATSMGIAGKDPADIILDNPENWKNKELGFTIYGLENVKDYKHYLTIK
jgi:DNA primase